MSPLVDALVDTGRVPDVLLRAGIRANVALRLARMNGAALTHRGGQSSFASSLACSAIAIETEKANEQHYEVPPDFFRAVLGPRLKYSSCVWPSGVKSLAAAEEAMLELTCARAEIEDGMTVLDLGCGWGSLSFWLSERYPAARIVAVTNSRLQRDHIERECELRGTEGLRVVVADVNDLTLTERFDRVVSIEMFEHVRNYGRLLEKLAGHLAPGGALFVHHFSHRQHAYPFGSSWMGRQFFSGGTMPSHRLLDGFSDHLQVTERWALPGTHYARTARAWLENLDAEREAALAALAQEPGTVDPETQLERWRVFFLACEGLFGFRGGREWLVSHALLRPSR